MEEGTWMLVKPKRKTPPSQDKGTAGSSRGCEETPLRLQHTISRKAATQETQVQTGTYKEAVVGIKMAIVHRLHPDVNLDQKVYIVPTLTTRISLETTGRDSWKI
jgi:hypothetical protein